ADLLRGGADDAEKLFTGDTLLTTNRHKGKMQRVPSGAPCITGLKTRNHVFNAIMIFMKHDQEKF
ncbi:MAG TPA: hypothetical protein PK953_11460, partial [Smithellaceae bacterium]|nr:hypothetical protein [Smithellaceae bacterium]